MSYRVILARRVRGQGTETKTGGRGGFEGVNLRIVSAGVYRGAGDVAGKPVSSFRFPSHASRAVGIRRRIRTILDGRARCCPGLLTEWRDIQRVKQ